MSARRMRDAAAEAAERMTLPASYSGEIAWNDALTKAGRAIRSLPLPSTTDDDVERAGKRLCAEKCAFYGDPPCWKMAADDGLSWTGDDAYAARCDEDCLSLARAAIAAYEGEDA